MLQSVGGTERENSDVDSTKSSKGTVGKFTTVHVVAYICSAVVARHYSGWQHSLMNGFGNFSIAQALTIFGCVCHYLCLMEIWSAVPFSGGNYALSRATLGFYLGFLDGVMEAFVYISHAALSSLGAAERICAIFQIHKDHSAYISVIFLLTACSLSMQSNNRFLGSAFIVGGTLSFIILLFYCLGMLRYVDFAANASLHRNPEYSHVDNWFLNGFAGFMYILPWTLQPYAGIRSFTMLTAMVKDPKVTLPRAVIWSFGIIISLNILVIFVFASQPGGIAYTARQFTPTLAGWKLLFDTSMQTATEFGCALILPGAFARVVAYLIPAGVLLHSLGKSNLMPSVLMVNHSRDHRNATIVSAIIGTGLAVMVYYRPESELFNLAIMGTMITDVTFLYGYWLLKTTYSSVPREFESPLGLWGAAFSVIIYTLIFISSGFFQKSWFALKFFAVFIGAMSAYYYLFAMKSQTLNEEEDQVFLKLHVRNYNMAKKNKIRRRQWWGGYVRLFSCWSSSARVAAAGSENDSDGQSEGLQSRPGTVTGAIESNYKSTMAERKAHAAAGDTSGLLSPANEPIAEGAEGSEKGGAEGEEEETTAEELPKVEIAPDGGAPQLVGGMTKRISPKYTSELGLVSVSVRDQ